MKSILFKLSLNIIFVIIISSASNYLLAFQVDEYLTNDEADTTEEMNIAPTFIDIGFSGFSLDYKENVPERPDFISEESGFIPGFCVGISSNQKYPFFVSGFVNYIKGDEDYNGGTMDLKTNIITPKKATTNSKFVEIAFALHYRFEIDDKFDVTPFVGYSIRSWNRVLGKGTNSEFEEVYKWKSLNIGAKWNCNISQSLSLAFSAQMNFMMKGTIDINFPGNYPIILDLSNIDGYKVEIPCKYKLNEKFALSVIPYVEHYAFGESNKARFQTQEGVIEINEPDSKTNNVGIKVIGSISF